MILWLAGCAGTAPDVYDPDEIPPFVETTRALAAELQGPARYADPRASEHADPAGLVVDPQGTVWVFSDAHPLQQALEPAGGGWTLGHTRSGPLRTRRCLWGEGATWCVGELERGGLWSTAGPASPLPPRGGYRDLALAGGQIHVLDAVDAVIHTLDPSGEEVRATTAVPASPLRLGALGEGHLWVATGTAPYVGAVSLGGEVRGVGATTPIRDAVYDAARDVLWTVGPVDEVPSRDGGPLVGLGTAVLGWPGAALREGREVPPTRWVLPEVVDGSRVVLDGAGDLWISATGADAVVQLDPESGAVRRTIPVGPAPQGLAVLPDGAVAVACRLDDAVWVIGDDVVRIALDDTPRDTAEDLGERLFYGAILWPTAEVPFTCNSCHWDQGVDHRQQPGREGVRTEQTRPIGGISAVHPVFSPGQGKSLDVVAEGFFRLLDPRFYGENTERWWLEPRTFAGKGGVEHTLDAEALRVALLTFLGSRPVEPGPLRGHPAYAEDIAAGWQIFERDCSGCHEPSRSMRERDLVDDVLGTTEPLTFGAPLWAKTGLPTYTPRGNKVSPLWMLGRGGPFFSDGSAPDLEAVLRDARPGTASVHRGGEGEPYTEAEVRVLEAFLLSR